MCIAPPFDEFSNHAAKVVKVLAFVGLSINAGRLALGTPCASGRRWSRRACMLRW